MRLFTLGVNTGVTEDMPIISMGATPAEYARRLAIGTVVA